MSSHVPSPSAAKALAHGAVATASTFAWYSMPDFVRCPKARAGLKSALAGVIAANETWYMLPTIHAVREFWAAEEEACCCTEAPGEDQHYDFVSVDADESCDSPASCDSPEPGEQEVPLSTTALVAGAIGVAAVVGGAIVAAERGIFRRGERRRATGVANAHLRQGVCFAALTAALCGVDYALDVKNSRKEDQLA